MSEHQLAKDLIAGTCGGISQVIVGQPFDTTKVRLQTAKSHTTPIQVLRRLLHNEGPLALYKGMLTPLLGAGACVSVQFGTNEFMKRNFRDYNVMHGRPTSALTLPQFYLCGAAGGVANSFLASPIEHVRIRLQVQTGSKHLNEFRGPFDCVKKLTRNGALMRGWPLTVLRAGHGVGMYFLTYEALVSHDKLSRENIPAWRHCFYGACAGATLWLAIYPIDVVKSVIQTDNLLRPKYDKTVHAIMALYKNGGVRSFFKGFVPTMLRAGPANGATFCTFELARRFLN